jgi:hypothetical protein
MPTPSKNGLRHVVGLATHEEALRFEGELPKDFDPNRLLDVLIVKMQLESDAALAHKLQVIHPIIRMIREGSLAMSTEMLFLWIQEATGITPEELRELLKTETGG